MWSKLFSSQIYIPLVQQFYSYGPDPKKDKQVTLIGIHFILTFATTLSIWLTIFVLLVCCGVSVNNVDVANQGTSIWWGQTSWIVLTAAVLSREYSLGK